MKTLRILFIAACVVASAAADIAPSQEEIEAASFMAPIAVMLHSARSTSELTLLPIPVAQRLPEYPIEMRRHTISGIAKMRVRIKEDGTVGTITTLQASQPEFESVAIGAVRDWKFIPCQEKGHPVAVEMDYTFEFRILDE